MQFISKKIAHVNFTGNIEYFASHFDEITTDDQIQPSGETELIKNTYGFLLTYYYQNDEISLSVGFSIIFVVEGVSNKEKAVEQAKPMLRKDLKSAIVFLLETQQDIHKIPE